MSAQAIVIEMHPEPSAALVADMHLVIARLPRALGEAWTKRHDLNAAANVLLEAHGIAETLDSLADELVVRAVQEAG